MKNRIKKLAIITIISTIFGLSASYFLNNYIYSKIIQENKIQAITLEEELSMKIETLHMCVQLSYGEDKNLIECSNMQEKIVDDIYAKLDKMPYTRFYYKYLDSKDTLKTIDRIKDINLFPHVKKDNTSK